MVVVRLKLESNPRDAEGCVWSIAFNRFDLDYLFMKRLRYNTSVSDQAAMNIDLARQGVQAASFGA